MTILLALSNALVCCSGMLYTRLAPHGTAFGYRVPFDFDRAPEFRRFNRSCILAALFMFVLTVALPAFAVPIGLAAIPVLGWCWLASRRHIQAHRIEGEVLSGSLTGDGDNIITVPPVSLLGYWLALAIILLTAAYVATRWPDIPATFATHFDGSMQPDAWSDKSVGSVFAMSILNLVVWLLLLGCMAPFLVVPIYARTDTSPGGMAATGAAVSASATALGWFEFALAAGLSLAQLAMVIPDWSGLMGVAVTLTLVGSIGGTIGLIAYIMHAMDKARARYPREYSRSFRSDSYYKAGMFYVNKDDPARIVDKRDGVGVSFNFAHPLGTIYLVTVLLVSFAPLLLVFL
ncbi:DUF1648 domain-containing protein [Corynebacterium hindlerae]|uniref:DUF1648 domain-containing protein n=1 Tax=Corynebacterium hindlerae TaxID=699041 RepID=UPI0031B73820